VLLRDLTQKMKQLKTENTALRSRVDEWNQAQKAPTPAGTGGGSDKEKKDLMDALVAKDDESSKLRQEIAKLREALLSVQATGDMSSALEMEREMRYEAERSAEKERNDRLAAEIEWNSLSEQVVEDMENSRRQYEKLSDSKAELEKELEVYRMSRSSAGGVSHELENKLVDTKFELRKAQNSLLELKGEAGYHVRVFFSIKGLPLPSPSSPTPRPLIACRRRQLQVECERA
jgi:chromosome segregation ATPase